VLGLLAHGAVWIIPVLLFAGVMFFGAMLSLRAQKRCPTCREPMQALDALSDTHALYEVLHCKQCACVTTLVHGHRSRFAVCPACRNRALRTTCDREQDARFIVHERCELCGYAHDTPHGHPPKLGRVIPFPAPNARARRRRSGQDGRP
jgi:uncharacterized protein YbaR (Trm112 family)